MMTQLANALVILVFIGAAVVACGTSEEPGQGATPAESAASATTRSAAPVKTAGIASAADAATEARRRYDTLCATCHGPEGKGDGAAAGALASRPRDYSSRAWQESVTDESLAKAIIGGGPAVGMSAAMPPSPDLKGKPEVVMELVKIIRAFGPQDEGDGAEAR